MTIVPPSDIRFTISLNTSWNCSGTFPPTNNLSAAMPPTNKEAKVATPATLLVFIASSNAYSLNSVSLEAK